MTAKNMNPQENTLPEDEVNESGNKVRSVYVDQARWDKMNLIRDALGDAGKCSWNLFADIAVEQLLASGLIPDETRKAIYRINQENGLDFLDDTGWRDAFKIREPWPETATNIRKIRENLDEIKAGLRELSQTVEDHATAMLEAEIVKPDPITDEADE